MKTLDDKIKEETMLYADVDPPFASDRYDLTNRQLEKIKADAFTAGAKWMHLELVHTLGCGAIPAMNKLDTRAYYIKLSDWFEKVWKPLP